MPQHLKQGSECPTTQPGKIRLYAMQYCPFSMRVSLVLAHHQIPHETVWINLDEKPDWFTSHIPGGKVPAIEQEGEKMVDSEMICGFLDQLHPEDSLSAASGPEGMDKAKKWWGQMFKPFHAVAFEAEVSDDQKVAFMDALKAFEGITDSPFISGSKVGLADFLVYPILDRLEACVRLGQLPAVTSDEFPHLFAWLDAMRALPAVSAVGVSEERHVKFGAAHKAGEPDFDI